MIDVLTWLSTAPLGPPPQGTQSLTLRERVAEWMAPDQGTLNTPEPIEKMYDRLIRAVSGMVMSYMNRDTLARVARTETQPSSRTGRIVLRHWPALSLTGISMSNEGTFASPAPGIALEPIGLGAQRIIADPALGGSLIGGPTGIGITYVSGYVRSEQVVIPSTAPYEVQTSSMFLADEGVATVGGGTVPHTVSGTGLYTFGSNIAGQTVVLYYSYVPEDIEQAVIDEVSLAFRSRQRIGEASKALPNAGGTVSYLPRRLSDMTKETLNGYRRVVPS